MIRSEPCAVTPSSLVAVVIPAYQAVATIAEVVRGVRWELPDAVFVVVDDGSSDGTGDAARRAGALVKKLAPNQGKGVALRAGIAAALAVDACAILTIDADGQHDPRFAPALLAALDSADIAIGARARTGSAMPWHRRATNSLASMAVSRCAGTAIPDAQSGYRAIRAEVARAVAAEGDRYEFETAFLIRAGRAGFRIAAVPVPTTYGAPSHFRLVADASRVVRTIWRHRTPLRP